jgi:predicted nucleic-acid-binding protein
MRLIGSPLIRFFVSDIAIFEFAYVLDHHYHLSRATISDMVRGLLTIKKIECNRELFSRVLALFDTRRSLSFADCYLAASASFMNAEPLWTFDRTLAKQAPGSKLVS